MRSIRQVPVPKLEVLGLLYFHSAFVLRLARLSSLPTAFPGPAIEVPRLCLPACDSLCWLGEHALSLSSSSRPRKSFKMILESAQTSHALYHFK